MSAFKHFQVRDVEESVPISSKEKLHLCKLLTQARTSTQLVKVAAQRYGWDKVKDLVRAAQPTLPKAQRGEIGEVIGAALLEEFFGYTIPVPKLCFTITANQSLPSTDVIAVKSAGGNLTEVCFVESKLRIKHDPYAAKTGYTQLKEDYLKKFPDMIRFVAERLLEKSDPLFNAFVAYLFERRETVARESFFIGLVWEQAVWKENALDHLDDEAPDPTLPRVVVGAVRIKNLRGLSDELFGSIGVNQVLDDD